MKRPNVVKIIQISNYSNFKDNNDNSVELHALIKAEDNLNYINYRYLESLKKLHTIYPRLTPR